MIGSVISHYRILERLGAGGVGEVYKAEDTVLKRTVALKFLPRSFSADPDARDRFVHEAQAASALDHPNICTIHEIDQTDDGQQYIVMACYEGRTLRKTIEQGPLDVDRALDFAIQSHEVLPVQRKRACHDRPLWPESSLSTPGDAYNFGTPED